MLPRLPVPLTKKREYQSKSLDEILGMKPDRTIGEVQINK